MNFKTMIFIVVIALAGYVQGIVKLVNCDFEAPYKAEIIHGVGVVAGTGVITGWLDLGE